MFTIKSLKKEKISEFYKHLSNSYVSEYELETKENFINKTIKLVKQYHLIFDQNGNIIGGFRSSLNRISDFFINLSINNKEKIIKSLLNYVKPENNEIEVCIKERYSDLFLKQNFKIKLGRYEMVLKLNHFMKKKFNQKKYKVEIVNFKNSKLKEIAEMIYSTYENSIDQNILGYNDKNKVYHMIKEIIEGNISFFKFLKDCSFIAFRENNIIGVILLALINQNPLILDFVVSKKFRGQGIGKRLLVKAIEASKKRFNELILTVTVGNTKAEHLYKSIGFKQISDPEYILTKKLV